MPESENEGAIKGGAAGAVAGIRSAIDLGARVKLHFRGPDRVRFLNGQVSNDVRRVELRSALPACVCNLKGKLDAVVQITSCGRGDDDDEAGFLVDGPAELRVDDQLFHRFDRYLIADQVELDDVSDTYALWHFLPGSDRPDLPGAVWKRSNRFGPEGHDLWLTNYSAEKLGFHLRLIPPEDPAVEALRIAHRVPRWGKELGPDVLPAEARLDRSAVDFHKGCYTGQEVVSRIQSVGRVNRILSLLIFACGEKQTPPEPGDELLPHSASAAADREATKAVGRVTSVSPVANADGTRNALAYLRRGHDSPGTTLRLVSAGQSVTLDNSTILEVREI